MDASERRDLRRRVATRINRPLVNTFFYYIDARFAAGQIDETERDRARVKVIEEANARIAEFAERKPA